MTISHWMARAASVAAISLSALLAQVPSPPVSPLPHIAQSAGPVAPWPNVPVGGTPPGCFEYTAVASGSFLQAMFVEIVQNDAGEDVLRARVVDDLGMVRDSFEKVVAP